MIFSVQLYMLSSIRKSMINGRFPEETAIVAKYEICLLQLWVQVGLKFMCWFFASSCDRRHVILPFSFFKRMFTVSKTKPDVTRVLVLLTLDYTAGGEGNTRFDSEWVGDFGWASQEILIYLVAGKISLSLTRTHQTAHRISCPSSLDLVNCSLQLPRKSNCCCHELL